MATIPLTGGMSGVSGADTNQFLNLGKPVVGNTGVANPNGGTSPIPSPVPVSGMPIGNNNGGLISGNPIHGGPFQGVQPTAFSPGVGTPGTLTPTNPVPTTGYTPSTQAASGNALGTSDLTNDQNKQLTDTFGKGTGSLLASEISNLGSDDSSYMQAYEKAMAPVNAENLATLNTTLGNEGISSNSSTAAIENADFESNVTSQEGLQEQQLQMNDLSQLIGLTESIEGPSVNEVNSGGFLNDLASVTSSIGNLIPFAGGNGGSGSNVPIGDSSQAGLLGMSNASTAGLQTTDLSDLLML